jgi:hypothetical protein
MQAAAIKAIRFGRATALAIGVGVILALVLGVATVALAAVPGDPFRLGKVNIISDATTALKGTAPDGGAMLQLQRDSGKGPVLDIKNTNPASNSRGVNIEVAPGQVPITVAPGAGKASNLNVDRLDGRDQQDFLSASRIYRVGNSQPKEGPGKGGIVTITAFPSPEEGLACDDGDVAIGGGGSPTKIEEDREDDLNRIVPTSSDSYQITFQDNGDPSAFRGFVMCSDSSAPFKGQ